MKARVDYTVRFSTPYHIGSGSASYRAQRELQREQHASGKTEGYVIPGSTMKGRCRSACELLAGAFELEVAYAPNPENLAGSGFDFLTLKRKENGL